MFFSGVKMLALIYMHSVYSLTASTKVLTTIIQTEEFMAYIYNYAHEWNKQYIYSRICATNYITDMPC